jgi:hypothetical protein
VRHQELLDPCRAGQPALNVLVPEGSQLASGSMFHVDADVTNLMALAVSGVVSTSSV